MFTVSMTGGKELTAALKQLKASVQNRGNRMAMTAAMRPCAKAIKRIAPKRTGQTKRSVGTKVKTYPSGVTVGMAGVRAGFAVQVGTYKRGKRKGQPRMHDPAKIYPILRARNQFPAENAAQGALPEAQKIFARKLGEFIEREATKARKG